MNAEVSPSLSSAVNAWRRSGVISCSHSWKNSMDTPSWLDALPFGRARMALPTSSKDRLLIKLAFASPVTMPGTFCQHRSWASAVPKVPTSDMYSQA
ncbi:unnamed protein product [Sphagnum jensenii]|uniref:Uncharacterized protein n=1 Tax=Sphagnum jensenii TaxID=128206 RepID=A0ABP1BFQ0_9BRYO